MADIYELERARARLIGALETLEAASQNASERLARTSRLEKELIQLSDENDAMAEQLDNYANTNQKLKKTGQDFSQRLADAMSTISTLLSSHKQGIENTSLGSQTTISGSAKLTRNKIL